MMKKFKVIIKGPKVIDVGYRPFLAVNAMKIGIKSLYAYNVSEKGEMVIVLVGDEERRAREYIDFIHSNFAEHAEVTSVEEMPFEGEIMEASEFYKSLQFEQITKAVPYIIDISKDQKKMLEKQDIMIEKQDIMIEKQDIMIEKQDIMIGKQDTTIGILREVKKDTSAIREDISALRKDTSESLYERYEELRREIAEIKATLSEIKAKVA
ncbi:MAG: Acylphosphatase [Methanosaeta sp. PtaU1.Bin016]|nr:MAG: Acylphosphatase [Methanosaeta sp. PtaU1.Bin016]